MDLCFCKGDFAVAVVDSDKMMRSELGEMP